MDLIAGALVVVAASFLGGVTGFGYSLVATPLLLLVGFPLPFVVTVNLALACVTRISVVRDDLRVCDPAARISWPPGQEIVRIFCAPVAPGILGVARPPAAGAESS
jgi:hypothetical protein